MQNEKLQRKDERADPDNVKTWKRGNVETKSDQEPVWRGRTVVVFLGVVGWVVVMAVVVAVYVDRWTGWWLFVGAMGGVWGLLWLVSRDVMSLKHLSDKCQVELRRVRIEVREQIKDKVSELKKKKRALELAHEKVSEGWHTIREEKAGISAAIRSLPRGFLMTNEAGEVMMVNAKLKQVLGKRSDIGSLDQLAEYFKDRLDVKQLHDECVSMAKAVDVPEVVVGEKILWLFFSPIVLDEQVTGCVLLVDDITKAKTMERVRDEFFAVASHELRTPLTAIRGNTSMIKQFYEKLLQDDQNLAEMIDDIHNSSVHLIDIVNDFLDVSKLEQNKVEYKMTAFDLGTLLTEALFDLETSAKDKGLDFGLVQSDKPVSLVYADEGRTREVVYNLVGNAIKYTEAGSVKVWLTEEKGMVVVRVVDTGMGISQESQRLLFRKFQRAGEGFLTQNVVQGTGLGLYVSKLLVEGMGGEISLEKSESGVGSTFVFKLRMAE